VVVKFRCRGEWASGIGPMRGARIWIKKTRAE
jgi:hypothetical protein